MLYTFYMISKSILIVEDETILSKVLGNKLKKAGYAVTNVVDGEEALSAIRKNHFDLILLDLIMPKTDGWTVLEHLKGKNIKILVISNLSQDEDIRKAKGMGAMDFLVKSEVSMKDIEEKVKQILE